MSSTQQPNDNAAIAEELIQETTGNTVTVLFETLRNGTRPVAFKRSVGNQLHVYWLNEHGAFCGDTHYSPPEAVHYVKNILSSEGYVGRDQGPAKDLWPGADHYKHPKYRGDRQ